MKKKELKQLAQKFWQQEKIIDDISSTDLQKEDAKNEIMKLSSQIKNLDDMLLIDELVQEMANKNF